MTVRAYQCFALVAALLLSCVLEAPAEQFPAKPLTLIVPWPAGGAADIELRALALATEGYLKQPIRVENRPGATGTLGPLTMARKSKPDGYVISQIPVTVLRLPADQNPDFEPERDFSFIIHVARYVGGIVVRAQSPWQTFADLLAYAKANPDRLTYATSGTEGTGHLAMKRVADAAGIQWSHVPFRGSAESVGALLGGHVDIVADGSAWAAEIDAGQLRLLATWGDERSSRWPNTPTLKELGINVTVTSQYGLAGPKGMDPDVVKILHDAFKQGMEHPAHRSAMNLLGQESVYLNGEDYRSLVAQQIEQERSAQQARQGQSIER